MFRIAIVAMALSGLSFAQEKAPKAPEWVEIKPERVEGKKAKRVLKIEDRVVFQIGFVHGTSFDKKPCVDAHLLMNNPTKKTLKAVLHVSLFDKDKRLVTTGRMSWGESFAVAIKPGEKSDSVSVTLGAPAGELDRVKFAQAMLYVSE